MTYHLYEETSHAKWRLDLIQFLPCKLWVKFFFHVFTNDWDNTRNWNWLKDVAYHLPF